MNDNPPVPSDPNRPTPAEQADHDRSVHDYPDIQFSPTEYVVIDVERSFWGIVRIWLFALAVFLTMAIVTILIDRTSPIKIDFTTEASLFVGTIVLTLLCGIVGTQVYRQNTFIVTNERIFACIQYTPFSQRNQNVEIEHIEDCSYAQTNPIQTILNYGSIRLSTIGDEQTYVFTFVDRPKEQFRIVNHVVQQVDEGQTTKYHGPTDQSNPPSSS